MFGRRTPRSARPAGTPHWQRASIQRQQPSTPPPPLGPLIRKITVRDLEDDAETLRDSATISDSALVASYNWLESEQPTVLVPGRPARWTPLPEPRVLLDDNGCLNNRPKIAVTRKYYRDRNAASFPNHPMEAAVLASLHMEPDLRRRGRAVDVVACSSTVGNLLRFVRGEDKTFRMLVELVGDTVFFVRREKSPTELIEDIQGYGHSFPESYTTWDADVKGSRTDQRVIRYRFGGLEFLIRFEADGYIARPGEKAVTVGAASALDRASALGPEDLLRSFGSTRIAPAEPTASLDAGLLLRRGGALVGQDKIFELKTRSIKKKDHDTLGEQLPRLWVARLNTFILAHHERGTFNDIEIIDVGKEVDRWEAENETNLAKLAALVHWVKNFIGIAPRDKMEICHTERGTLEIREQLPDAGDALSPEAKARWVGEFDADRQSDRCGDDDRWLRDSADELDDEDDGGFGEKDYTACLAEGCGYCGRCKY